MRPCFLSISFFDARVALGANFLWGLWEWNSGRVEGFDLGGRAVLPFGCLPLGYAIAGGTVCASCALPVLAPVGPSGLRTLSRLSAVSMAELSLQALWRSQRFCRFTRVELFRFNDTFCTRSISRGLCSSLDFRAKRRIHRFRPCMDLILVRFSYHYVLETVSGPLLRAALRMLRVHCDLLFLYGVWWISVDLASRMTSCTSVAPHSGIWPSCYWFCFALISRGRPYMGSL